MSLFMLGFPLCLGLLLQGEALNQKKSKTLGPSLLVVVTRETQTAMVDAAISVGRRLLFILVFHFYLIYDVCVRSVAKKCSFPNVLLHLIEVIIL